MENSRATPKNALLTVQTEAQWAQATRRLLAQSNAVSLVANNNGEDEIKAAALKLGAQLEEALRGWMVESTTLNDIDDMTMALFIKDEITGFVKLVGGGWQQSHREEFVDQCVEEFGEVPYSVLLPSVRRARRQVYEAKRFVSWVFEDMDKALVRLENEGRILRVLAQAAGIAGA